MTVGALAIGTAAYSVPAGATLVTPGNLGSAAAAAAQDAVLVLRGGTYNESVWTPSGKRLTIQAYPGEAVWLDGGGTRKNALVAQGLVHLKGIGIRNCVPDSTFWLKAMAYFNTRGSTLENCRFTGSAMDGLGFETGITVTNCTFDTLGRSGVMGTTCDDLLVEDCLFTGMNRASYPAEPETAAVKITRAARVTLSGNEVNDLNGGYGLWFDVSCIDSTIESNNVDGSSVGGRARSVSGIEVEESERVVVHNNTVTGCSEAGLKILVSGHVTAWGNDLRGNDLVGLYLQQDRPQNSGTLPANRTNAECPWYSVGTVIVDNTFDSPFQFIAYDDGPGTLRGADMFTRIEGNWFAPVSGGSSMVQLGPLKPGSRVTFNTLSALAAAPSTVGSIAGKLGTNYQGTDPSAAAAVRVGTMPGSPAPEVATSTTGRSSVLWLGGDATAPTPPSDVPIATDQTYSNRGYSYTGTGEVEYSPAVVPDPANRTRQPVRRIHESLPAPTLVNGRPR